MLSSAVSALSVRRFEAICLLNSLRSRQIRSDEFGVKIGAIDRIVDIATSEKEEILNMSLVHRLLSVIVCIIIIPSFFVNVESLKVESST